MGDTDPEITLPPATGGTLLGHGPEQDSVDLEALDTQDNLEQPPQAKPTFSDTEREVERPRQVGQYYVGPIIGRGASATVYEGLHVPTRKPVAIKIQHKRWRDSSSLEARFAREARTATAVAHPNIVRLLDAGEEADGLRWQALELLQGRDLATVLLERPLEIPEVFALGRQLLDALAALHAAGYVHRDVKPENLFVVPEDDGLLTLKLIDFGIAKPLVPSQSMPALTGEGVMIGTPEFMCPEQITGDSPISPASDLWSAGAVLFSSLAGHPPFQARQLSKLLLTIARERAPSVLQSRVDTPPLLAQLVARALEREPELRFRSASQMREALDKALEGLPDLGSWF